MNHNATDDRDRNLRESLLEKLVDELDNEFKKEDIKQEWHSPQVSCKRDKAREEGSKTSESGCSEVYYSTWEHFNLMEFLDDTANVDESHTSLDSGPYVPPSKRKRRKKRKKGMQNCSYGSL